MNEVPETTQFDVNLPKPRTRKVLIGVLVAVLVLGVIGVAAAAIANRTAQGPADPTARIMPANTMLFFSLNTHTEKLPNFNVIADAWKDSQEAKQVASAIQLAFMQAGFNWEDDVQPWLGDRVSFGLIDLGSMDTTRANAPHYRTPFFLVAAQTTDHTKSDAFLAALGKQLSKAGTKQSVQTETYRNISISYLTSSGTADSSVAWATVNDSVVLTVNPDNLKTAINAALDGQNLTTSDNFKTVMSSLADQNAGAFYMDYSRFMPAYFDMITGLSTNVAPIYLPCEFEAKSKQVTPDADCVKQRQDQEQSRAQQQSKIQEEMQGMRDLLQAIGGTGVVMTYEPTGIRFDIAAQYDLSKVPEKWQKYMNPNQIPAANRVFGSLPSSTILAVNGSLQNSQLDLFLDPNYWAMTLSSLPEASRNELTSKFTEFQKLIGIDLKADFLDLLNGEAAFAMLPKADQTKSEFGFSLPFQFAAMFDSSDAAKASSSLDKIVQGASALMGKDGVKWQSLSGLPYSVVLDSKGKPLLTYGVVDSRLIIGTDSSTLQAIGNAKQASLADDALFKQATGLLPGNRLNTVFMNFQPIWDLVKTASGSQGCKPCAYLQHFGWISAASEPLANGMERGSLHIGITK